MAPTQIRRSRAARRCYKIQGEDVSDKNTICFTNLQLTLAAAFRFTLGIAATEIDMGISKKWFYNKGIDILVDIGIPAEKEVIQ